MKAEALWRLDATAQAGLVRRGEVTAHELLEAGIERVERLNPRVNAVVTPLYELARAQARERTGGPFDGVPLLLKDAGVEVEGTPQYLGTRLLREIGYRSPETDELGRRLRAAGFVFVGKTNIPPLSSGVTTEPPAFGVTRNPWALERTAGGSSGGSAAAVAAGMVSIAHGADATGSLRFPASACGVVTLNPSSRIVPCTTPAGQPDAHGVWRAFVLARSVRDLSGVLGAIVDLGALPPPLRRLPRLRIGLMPDFPTTPMPVDADCGLAVERAGRTLEGLGHRVEVSHPAALERLFMRIREPFAALTAEARAAQLRWLESVAGRPITDDDVAPRFLDQARAALSLTEGSITAAGAEVFAAAEETLEWWDDHDVLVTPVMRRAPWPLGEDAGPTHIGGFVQASSLTGQPALSLPLHWTPEGLPVGVQIVGAPRADHLLLALAAELEQAMPWADRWPAIAEE